jgi:adenylate cyclase
MAAGWIRKQRGAVCVGLAVTLAAAVLQVLGLFQRIEWLFLDAYFRQVNRIEASRQIVHVDIDDASLDRVGAWPWPRDVQADLVRILHEIGAKTIALDLVYSEPRPAELRLPQFTQFAAIEGEIRQFGQASEENVVDPDPELAAAVRDASNAYLSTYYKSTPSTPDEQKVVALYTSNVDTRADEIAARLGWAAGKVKGLPLARLRRQAIAQRVMDYLKVHPAATAEEVHRALRVAPFDVRDPVREDVLWAYMRTQSLRALERHCHPVPPGLAGRLKPIDDLTPPLFSFLGEGKAGARGVGFVVFDRDPDGKVRHLPLMLEFRGRLLRQLAFAVFCDDWDVRDEDLSIDDGGFLHIAPRGDRPAMVVQLDADRRILLNWHRDRRRKTPSWADSFIHVPAVRILEVRDLRQAQHTNETTKQILLGQVVELAMPEGFPDYTKTVRGYLEMRRELHRTDLEGRGSDAAGVALRARADEQRRRIEAVQVRAAQLVNETWNELKTADPSDETIAKEYQRFKKAHGMLAEACAKLDATNAVLEKGIQDTLASLRPVVVGRICFVGHTATAVADMVDTPIFAGMPGVLVHSNLLNTFIQRKFLRWSQPWERVLIIVGVGMLVTLLSASRGPRASFVLVIATMLALALINFLSLALGMRYWLAVVSAVALAFVAWAMVVMFRFLVSEREKRRFSKALAQYTSPAIARQIAEDVGRLDLSPVGGEVTCFFSDLANFTTLTEQYLDPAKTRSVLNPYLDAMSRVLNARLALINKFMGDGIFAFFNPPVYPCADHARQACEAAIEAQQALRDLIARQKGSPLANVFDRLSMRIGIASGPVYVGDYGSENKLDYTCMGDTVNLAARLEPANKAFGTAILVSGPTRDAAGDGLAFRRLGSLQVKGKKNAVPVYELLGRAREVRADALEYADRFAAAVDLFQTRRWEAAAAAFRALLTTRSDDIAARRYVDVVAGYQASPPPEPWNGAIELTEK